MRRIALGLLLLAGAALAHGGVFRPPPGGLPGDPFTPGGRGGPATARSRGGFPFSPWQAWWFQNREPYLRLRQRVLERTVVTGERTGKDLFDRAALRTGTLIPLMTGMLRDEDEELRTSAAVALGKYGAKEAIPVLLDLLRSDKSRQVREASMLGLALMRDAALAPRLRSIVLDGKEHTRVRGFGVLGLGFLGDGDFLLRLLSDGEGAIGGSRPSVEELRTAAATALGWARLPSTVLPLLGAALDPELSEPARGSAAASLGRLANPLALPDLLALVGDGDAKRVVRCGAAIACGTLVGAGEEGVIDLLGRKAHRDRDGGVRTLLVMSLGRIGGERAATQLAMGLSACDQEDRGFYHLALGISGHADAGSVLMEEFERLKNPSDRAACALGLALAGHKAAAPMLRDRLKEENPAFAPHAMVALGILDDAASIPTVEKIVREANDPVIQREGTIALALLKRGGAIDDLLGLLRESKTTWNRAAVAWALGLIGTERAVAPLVAIVRDKGRQGEERAIALAALGRIGDGEDVPLLAAFGLGLNPYVISDVLAEAFSIL